MDPSARLEERSFHSALHDQISGIQLRQRSGKVREQSRKRSSSGSRAVNKVKHDGPLSEDPELREQWDKFQAEAEEAG